MTHYSDVLGNYATATEIMREFYRTGGGLPLAQWIEQKSRELWAASGEHRGEDWRALADQLDRDALHGEWTLDDVAAGWAQVVRCPDCGAMEIWCEAEINDHGLCRSAGRPCEVCGR